jgi:hypothetical protein
VLLVLSFAMLSTPSVARGSLAVQDGTVEVGPTRRSTFRFSGRVTGLSLEGATYLGLQLDRFAFVLPMDTLSRRGATYQYRGRKGVPGLRRLKLDTKKGRFTLTGQDLALGGIGNPARLEFVTDTDAECTMLRFVRKASRRPKAPTRLALNGTAGGCELPDGPTLDPGNVLVGQATDVVVQVVVPAGVTVDADGVRLYRVGRMGRPEGAALCALRDDANVAQGDERAGDGVFSCRTAFHETAAASTPLMVEAASGSTRLSSPSTTLRVVAPRSDADPDTVVAVQTAAAQVWTAQQAALGDTMAARVATIAALAARPDVYDAVLAADQRSIEVELVSGVAVLLALAPRTVGAAALGVAGALVDRPAALIRHANPHARPGAARTDVTVVERRTALIFDPGQLWFPESENEAPDIHRMLTDSVCPRFESTIVRGRAATLASLEGLSQYGTFVASSHGGVDSRNQVVVLTGEESTSAAIRAHFDDLQARDLVVVPSPTNPADIVLAMRPNFVRRQAGDFGNGLVYLSSCYGQYNGTMTSAFLGKGAGAVFGFDISVSSAYASSIGRQLFRSLVSDFATSGEAYDAAQPKADTHPVGNVVIVRNANAIRRAAYFQMAGSRDVAYLGAPAFPQAAVDVATNSTVALTVELPGAEECDLIYHWVLMGSASEYNGYIQGGDDQERLVNTVTYISVDPLVGGTDTVWVEVFALGSAGQRVSLGTASVQVNVRP